MNNHNNYVQHEKESVEYREKDEWRERRRERQRERGRAREREGEGKRLLFKLTPVVCW